ncbi:SAM-dependent methyltransferase [Nocardia beijingensis]|uniref:SAM-dependent methyltransferase n=1 Tax=Nocardia beijingensis TaxID=95162 RepID=UPI003330CEE9
MLSDQCDERQPLSGLGLTALAIARSRAEEHDRPDRLFADPLAQLFLPSGGTVGGGGSSEFMRGYFALRTRFFDDCVRGMAESGCRQVVLLGAGLDTRAFRMGWPAGARLFELDLPDTLAHKEKVLVERGAVASCHRVVIPADLRTDWLDLLVEHGLRSDQPTAWLAEGLLMYLTEEENRALLTAVGALSGQGSMLAVEHVNPETLALPQFQPVLDAFARIGAPWRSAVHDPHRWLAASGWRAEVTDPAVLARGLGRPVPPAMDPEVIGAARLWLIRATWP